MATSFLIVKTGYYQKQTIDLEMVFVFKQMRKMLSSMSVFVNCGSSSKYDIIATIETCKKICGDALYKKKKTLS